MLDVTNKSLAPKLFAFSGLSLSIFNLKVFLSILWCKDCTYFIFSPLYLCPTNPFYQFGRVILEPNTLNFDADKLFLIIAWLVS